MNNSRTYIIPSCRADRPQNSLFVKTAAYWNHLDNAAVHATSLQRSPNTSRPSPNTIRPSPNTSRPSPNTSRPSPYTSRPPTRSPYSAARLLDEAVYISRSSLWKSRSVSVPACLSASLSISIFHPLSPPLPHPPLCYIFACYAFFVCYSCGFSCLFAFILFTGYFNGLHIVLTFTVRRYKTFFPYVVGENSPFVRGSLTPCMQWVNIHTWLEHNNTFTVYIVCENSPMTLS